MATETGSSQDHQNYDMLSRLAYHLMQVVSMLMFPWRLLDRDASLWKRLYRWRYSYAAWIGVTLVVSSEGLLNGSYQQVAIAAAPHVIGPALMAYVGFVSPTTTVVGLGLPVIELPDLVYLGVLSVVGIGFVTFEVGRRAFPRLFPLPVTYEQDLDEELLAPMDVQQSTDDADAMPRIDQDVSTLVLGETGAGKTETIRTLAYQYPYDENTAVIAHDFSNDFQEFYADLGFDVVRISDLDSDAKWNLFRDIRKESDVRQLADAIFGEPEGHDPFHTPAKQAFYGGVVYLYRQAHDPNVNDLTPESVGHDDLLEFFTENELEELESKLQTYDDLTFAAEQLSVETGNKANNVYSELQEYLNNVFVDDFAEHGTFSLREYLDNPNHRILIVDTPQSRYQAVGPLISSLLNWAVSFAIDSENPTNFILDELDRLPAFDGAEAITAQGRSEETRALIGVQTIGQLRAHYGEETAAITGNCPQGVYMAPGDEDTTEFLQSELGRQREQTGSQTIRRDGHERRTDSISTTISEEERYPVPSGQLKQMGTGDAVVVSRQQWWYGNLHEHSLARPRLEADPTPDRTTAIEVYDDDGAADDDDDDGTATDRGLAGGASFFEDEDETTSTAGQTTPGSGTTTRSGPQAAGSGEGFRSLEANAVSELLPAEALQDTGESGDAGSSDDPEQEEDLFGETAESGAAPTEDTTEDDALFAEDSDSDSHPSDGDPSPLEGEGQTDDTEDDPIPLDSADPEPTESSADAEADAETSAGSDPDSSSSLDPDDETASGGTGTPSPPSGEGASPVGTPPSSPDEAVVGSLFGSDSEEEEDQEEEDDAPSDTGSQSDAESDAEPMTSDPPSDESPTDPYTIETHYPAEMQARDTWLTWKADDGRKIPRAPWYTDWPDKYVSAQDPDAWMAFARARKATEDHDGHELAFVIRDREEFDDEDLVLIDYDDVRDPDTGAVHPTVQEWIDRTGSFAQVSTSGTGIHVLCRGELPDGLTSLSAHLPPTEQFPSPEIEIYDSARFIAMTGDHIEQTPDEVTNAQAFLDDVAELYQDALTIVYEGGRNPMTGDIHPTTEDHLDHLDDGAHVVTDDETVQVICRADLPPEVSQIKDQVDTPDWDRSVKIKATNDARRLPVDGEMPGEYLKQTRRAQAYVDYLAETYATITPRAPSSATRDPERSRGEIEQLESTDEISDIFDAIEQTKPRDIRLKSTITEERADGTLSLDPSWEHSESGTRIAQVDEGWIYRDGMYFLDPLQIVALEERMITDVLDYPNGKTFWKAVDELRDRGAPIPHFEPRQEKTE